MTADILRELVVPLLTAAATWGAIRADIRHLHTQVRDLREDISEVRKQVNRTRGYRVQ